MFSCEFCEFLKIIFFIEHLRSVAFTGINCVYLLILFFTRFKLTLRVGTKPITIYSKIPLSKNSYHIKTRTVFYIMQVFTERYFRTGCRTQWVFRCSKSTVFKLIIKTPVRCLYCELLTYPAFCPIASIVDYEQANTRWEWGPSFF